MWIRTATLPMVRAETPNILAHSAWLLPSASIFFSRDTPLGWSGGGRPPCLPQARISALLWALAFASRPKYSVHTDDKAISQVSPELFFGYPHDDFYQLGDLRREGEVIRKAILEALLGDSERYFGLLDNERKLAWIVNLESDDEILPVIERRHKPAIFLFVQCRAGDSKFSGKRLPDQ